MSQFGHISQIWGTFPRISNGLAPKPSSRLLSGNLLGGRWLRPPQRKTEPSGAHGSIVRFQCFKMRVAGNLLAFLGACGKPFHPLAERCCGHMLYFGDVRGD